jgi:hypothetical protein
VAKFHNSKVASASSDDAQNLKFERADWTAFRTVEGLQQKAGVPARLLRRLVLKELADNGLDTDASVTVGEIDGGYFIEDDGPGINPDEVASLFSIGRPLASTKMLRLPTRGALGNGLRVTAGAVLASDGKLAVITRGVRLELKPQRDGTTAMAKRRISNRQIGTRIEISFGPALPNDPHALHWASQARILAKGGSSYVGQSSPYWYDAPQFHELLSASGSAPVRSLMARLDGCAGGRAGEIVAIAGLGRKTCHEIDAAGAARLLRIARSVAKPVNPKRLGAVGPEGFWGYSYAIAYGEAKFGMKPLEAMVPFAVEAWAVKAATITAKASIARNVVSVSVNRTPIAADFTLRRDKTDLNLFGCGLRHTVAKTPQGGDLTLWLNVMTPYMPITSDGKEPNLEPFVDAIADAAGKAVRKARGVSASGKSQKDVVLDHLDEVIDIVSGGALRYRFNERQLFYRLRPIVLEATGKELKLGNFTGIITDYENENGEIPLMYREPRGSITHPHRDETITLGTIMVEQYERPVWNFNKLLYIEKEGAQEALKQDRWPERHDCAVMSSKGFSTRAARDLIDKLVEHDEPVEVFCAIDADAPGSMIYQTLQEETRARGARKIKITLIGLAPWEAVAMGLEVETLTVEPGAARKPTADYIKNRDGTGDVDAEGNDISDRDWDEWLQTHRIELNAMTTPGLIDWLDSKMEEHGSGKLIPPTEVLENTFMTLAEERLTRKITERILREADLDGRVAEAMAALDRPDGEALRRSIEDGFEDDPEAAWRDIIKTAADEES